MKDDKKVISHDVKNRRALLKGLVAGSAVVTGSKALPENWTKPVTDAVILPGHARTSNGDLSPLSDGYIGIGGDYGAPEDGYDDVEDQGDDYEYGDGGYKYSTEDNDNGTDDNSEDDDHNADDFEYSPAPA